MPSSPEAQTPAAPPAAGNAIEHQVRAALTRATGSLSVGSGLLAAADWAMNLMVSPGKQMELALRAFEYAGQVARYDLECALAGPGEAPGSSRRPATANYAGATTVYCSATSSRAISEERKATRT